MSDMVDRVAIAIEKEFESYRRVLDAGQAEGLARASIDAMREPTDDMRRAGLYRGPLLNDRIENPEAPWQRMIDEALR